jgi:hypothetical protein
MERGNAKHNPREDDELAAELRGTLGPHGSNREEWVDPEPPADDDVPDRVGPPVEELAVGSSGGSPDGSPEIDAQVQHDLDVANDWHDSDA